MKPTWLVAPLLLAAAGAKAQEYPNRTYSASERHTVISPDMGAVDHNQPSALNGYLLLAGNGSHEIWDIADPYAPELVSLFESPFNVDEAESHQVAFAKRDGRTYAVMINGLGVDLWDLTDVTTPALLSTVELPGVNYGDNTEAVWGVFWQGDAIYVGGTNTGLHIVDASDPDNASLHSTMATSEFGGVSAGVLWAIGNLLIVTTPKEHAGIATLDISRPFEPAVLDFIDPENDSYIGGFYGAEAYLVDPLRTYDVTSDPAQITQIGEAETPDSEYLSFADGHLFLGSLRPNPGVRKAVLGDPNTFDQIATVEGRRNDIVGGLLTDDQFSLPIGNLLILSDDEIDIGSAIAVHAAERDTDPPEVLYVNPPDGASRQAPTTRIGLSFSDQIDFRSVDTSTVVVRPLGGDALEGTWSNVQTVVGFWPDEPLLENTTYEVIVPAGGVRDLVGNATATEFRTSFSTGESVASLNCQIPGLEPSVVGEPVVFQATDAGPDVSYTWEVGDQAGSGATFEFNPQQPARSVVRLTVESDGLTRSCTSLHISHAPLTEFAPTRSSTITESGGVVWAVSHSANALFVAEPGAPSVQIDLDGSPSAVVEAGLMWVLLSDRDMAVEYSQGDLLHERSVALPHGGAPAGAARRPGTEELWVVLENRAEVVIIDTVEAELVGTVPLPTARSRGIAFTADDRALVSRFISSDDAGEIYVIDAAQRALIETVELAIDTREDSNTNGRGLPNYLGSPVVSPDGRWAWVPSKKDNIERGLARDGQPMTTMNTVRSIISAFSLETMQEIPDARVDFDDHNMAIAAEMSPNGDLVFVLSMGTNQVDVLDAYTQDRVGGASVGFGATGLVLSGDRLFVNNEASGTISVFDVSELLAGRSTTLERLELIQALTNDPLSPEERLGLQLFVNADSRQLSQDGYISCATCHFEGRDDGRVWDFTDRGEGLRNTTDLRGRAGVAHGPVHWTGNFDEIQDFEHDIRTHFGGTGLMADEDFLDGRDHPLAAPKEGVSSDLDALAAYVSTLDEFPRSPLRNRDGTMTDTALDGERLFRTLDCLDCHSGQALTDSAVDVRHDVGTATETSGQRLGELLDGFDTPTLRGLAASPPYLHDGSALTIEETLRIAGHGNAQELSDTEMQALVAFLLQIENEEVDLTRITVEPAEDTGIDASFDVANDAGGEQVDASEGSDGGCTTGRRTRGGWWLLALAHLGRGRRRERVGE